MKYKLMAIYDNIVFIILFLVGSFQLLISLWHTTETYNFISPLSAICIFLIMLTGLANIMNGFAFSKSQSKINYILLLILSAIYISLISAYLVIVFKEEMTNENVTFTFGLIRSIIIMGTSGFLIIVTNILATKQILENKNA